MQDYDAMWGQVETLPWCSLVTTGRVGADFFQSLLDSHPEIFVFNGVLFFHQFWEQYLSTVGPDDIDPANLTDDFINKHMEKLNSRLDHQERKDQLGENKDQAIDIDLPLFRQHMVGLLSKRPVTSKNTLTAVYVSYGLCLGQDIGAKKLFFHHIHHIWKLDAYLADFPDSKIISMTRDPRATYVSGIENWRKYNPQEDHPARVLFVLNRTMEDASALKAMPPDRFHVLRLEDLGDESILHSICNWLGVAYDGCLKKSSWGGLRWWGDRLSLNKIPREEEGFSPTIISNNWERKLGTIDKFLLNYLMNDRLECYGYDHKKGSGLVLGLTVLLLIPVPTIYEWRFLSPGYAWTCIKFGHYKRTIAGPVYYFGRLMLFYKALIRRWFGRKFDLPLFRHEKAAS
jgi:hypothetical protein